MHTFRSSLLLSAAAIDAGRAVPHEQTKPSANPGEMPDIPASLKRKPVGDTNATMKDSAAKAIAAKHNAAKTPKQPTSSVLRDALKGGKAKVVATTGAKVVGKLAARPDSLDATAKASKKAPAHKPTTIVRTADNPAKSIVPSKFKAMYAEHNDTNGAKLNMALKAYTTTKNAEGRDALDLDLLREVATTNGIDFSRYEEHNNGQKRMNVGNRLAGLVKAGKTVVIGKQKFADREKALAKPEPAAHAAA